MLVKDVMKTNILAVEAHSTLRIAAEKMLSSGAETLFVVENEHLLGVIGLRDLFTAPVPAHYGGSMTGHRSEEQLLEIWERTPVDYLMNQKIIAVNEDTPLLRAAELMVNTGKHPLPVLRDGKVVGTVSRADVVQMLLSRQNYFHQS